MHPTFYRPFWIKRVLALSGLILALSSVPMASQAGNYRCQCSVRVETVEKHDDWTFSNRQFLITVEQSQTLSGAYSNDVTEYGYITDESYALRDQYYEEMKAREIPGLTQEALSDTGAEFCKITAQDIECTPGDCVPPPPPQMPSGDYAACCSGKADCYSQPDPPEDCLRGNVVQEGTYKATINALTEKLAYDFCIEQAMKDYTDGLLDTEINELNTSVSGDPPACKRIDSGKCGKIEFPEETSMEWEHDYTRRTISGDDNDGKGGGKGGGGKDGDSKGGGGKGGGKGGDPEPTQSAQPTSDLCGNNICDVEFGENSENCPVDCGDPEAEPTNPVPSSSASCCCGGDGCPGNTSTGTSEQGMETKTPQPTRTP